MNAGRVIGRVLFVLGGVVLGAAAVEATLQLVPGLVPLTIRVTLADQEFRTTRPQGRCGFVFRPDLDTLYVPTAEMSYRLKTIRAPDPAIGLRDDGWTGAPWAVATGDSFTAGMGVELPEAWSERLEASLHRDVVNLGVDGYGSQQETAILREIGLPLGPKVALYLVDFNDPGDCVKYLDAATRRARESSALAEAIGRAPHRRPVANAEDAATTLAGWVAPLRPRPTARQLLASGDDGGRRIDAARGGTLVARFVAPAAALAGAAKGKRTQLLKVSCAERVLDLLLLPDRRVRVELSGDPLQPLTSDPIAGAPDAVHSAVVVSAADGAVSLAVDDQPARRVRGFSVLALFAGPLELSAPAERRGGPRELREVRWFDEALDPLDALRDDAGGDAATAGETGPRGPWLNSDAATGLHSVVDREGRLHVVALGAGPPLEVVATRPVARDRPTHLACIASATGLELFVDGVPAGSVGGKVAQPCLQGVALGRDGDARGYVGAFGTTCIFSKRLDAAVLARLATRGADGSAPLPDGDSAAAAGAIWRFRGGDGRVFDDASGCGNPAVARGECALDEEGFVRMAGRGGVEVRARPDLESIDLGAGRAEAGRRTLLLRELLHLFRRDGLYALSADEKTDWLPFKSGPIDQVFRKSAVEGRHFRPDKNALEFCEGVGYVLDALEEARRACDRAGVKLVAVTSASKEAVYFPQAREFLGEEVAAAARPDWVLRWIENDCAQRGIPCISLLEPLRQAAARGENLYFRIDPHWNAAGHRVAAEAIEAGLRGMGLLDPGK